MTTSTLTPAYLAPDWRYAGDAWAGANALTYVVYATAPVYAPDGVTVTHAGVPQNLAGCSVAGALAYPARCGSAPAPQPIAASLPIPVGAVVDAAAGLISLSLQPAQTIFPRQDLAVWGTPGRALLLIQPRIVDAAGNPVTVGLQPLFVF